MSVFERPKGSGRWVAKFQLDGEQHWVEGSPFASEKLAKEAERQHRARLRRRSASDETCKSFAERWVVEWPRKSPASRALYEQAARRFADEFGPTPLGEVERLNARTWALGVPRNISKICGTMYEDARNVGLVESNPFSNLRLPASEKTEEVTPPDLDEFRNLLNGCLVLGGYATEFRALITFTAWTGLRAGEVQALRWADIGEDSIYVRRARKSDGSYGKPKNGLEREIAFPEPAKVLDQIPRWEEHPDQEFVFHTPRGERLKKGNLYYHWDRARNASGTSLARLTDDLRPVRFHDLRHFCATQLLEMGLSHYDVSVHLGHTDGGALVMARYGHPSKDAARARLRALWAAPDVAPAARAGAER